MDALSFTNKYIFLLIVLLFIPFTSQAKVNSIIGFKVSNSAHGLQYTIETTNLPSLHYFTLGHPARLVIDFDNAHLKKRRMLGIKPNALVKSIRTSAKKNHRLRLVFDLAHETPVKVSYLRAKQRQHYLLKISFPIKVKFLSLYHQKTTPLPITKPPGRKIMIVIDPGHGGKDPGATGPRGIHEKDIVLKISKALQQDINRQPGFKAVLTRKSDYYLTLRQRLQIARRYHADMFIAIHADADPGRHAEGASVFALSLRGATSEAARWIAKNENASELVGGVDLGDKSTLLKSVLLNLSQTATIRASLRIGQRIIDTIDNVVHLHHNKVEQAAFVVLKSPDIPSLLIETGFITNPREERKLINHKYQQKLAIAIMQGIRHYFIHWTPRNTWLAQHKI